jgi:hypothetical protein
MHARAADRSLSAWKCNQSQDEVLASVLRRISTLQGKGRIGRLVFWWHARELPLAIFSNLRGYIQRPTDTGLHKDQNAYSRSGFSGSDERLNKVVTVVTLFGVKGLRRALTQTSGGPMAILWLHAKDERRLQGTSWRSVG